MVHPTSGALFLALLATLASGQDVETLAESWPDGSPKVERQVIRDEAGEPVEHGDYKSWHESGQMAAEGRCKNGLKVGEWRTWHASGQLATRGVYRRGLRTQRWTYLDENGARDGGESGDYRAEFNEYPNGAPESRGEYRFKSKHGHWVFFHTDGSVREEGRFKLGKRSGKWLSYWPDGKKLFEGTYARGEKDGDWTFFHTNGYPDPAFLSGVYAKGERTGPLAEEPLDPDSPWFDLAALPDPAPYPLTGGDRKHLDDLFQRFPRR